MSKGNYVLGVGSSAIHRLQILNNAYGPFSRQFIETLGIKPGMSVADIGCGTGEMSLWFAKMVGPQGKVCGVDLSAAQIAVASERALQAGFTNTEFVTKNIYDIGELNQQFDIVYGRFVIAFTQDRKKALQTMYGLVKPQGIIASEELEAASWAGYPNSPAFNEHIELFNALGAANKMDFNTGLKLYNYFRELGFPPDHLSVNVPVFLSPQQKQHMVLVTEEGQAALIAANLATAAQLQQLISQLKLLVEADNFFMLGGKVFQVAARKK